VSRRELQHVEIVSAIVRGLGAGGRNKSVKSRQ